jgi:ATP-dependent Clp protease ATP-binding subunit ClpA
LTVLDGWQPVFSLLDSEMPLSANRRLSSSVEPCLTQHVRHVLAIAVEEAERLDHRAVGTGHLLIGLLREPEGLAAQMLADWGVAVPTARGMLAGLLGRGEGRFRGEVTLSPEAKRALRLAQEEARAMEQPLVDTEHLLVGIMLVEEDSGAVILAGHEVWLRHVHREIRRRRSHRQERLTDAWH